MGTIRNLFADRNLRCTTQRLAIYEALCQRMDHPTAEELYRMVKPQTQRLSLATVYNTLEALCRAGLARKMSTGNGCCRYDADTTEHVHLLFRESGEIHDVPDELGCRVLDDLRQKVVAEIERRMGVKVEGLDIQLVARRNGQRARRPVLSI